MGKHHPESPIDFMMQYLEKSRSKSQGSQANDTFLPPCRSSQNVNARPGQDVKADNKSEATGVADPSENRKSQTDVGENEKSAVKDAIESTIADHATQDAPSSL